MTCGSGGPKRRANATYCAGVSDWSRSTSTWPRKNVCSTSANPASESGCERSTSEVSSPKPGLSGFTWNMVKPPVLGPNSFGRGAGRINPALLQELRSQPSRQYQRNFRPDNDGCKDDQHRHQHDHRVLERITQPHLRD